MNPQVSQRVSPNWVALTLVLLLASWLAFEFYPRPAPGPDDGILARVPTKLELAGLPEGQDFEGIPAFFAAYANQAEWRDNRTRFAYWHPVMKTYSYYFEAIRNGERVSFKEITEPHEPNHFWDETLGEDCPIRFYISFPDAPIYPDTVSVDPAGDSSRVKVNVDILAPNILPPNTEAISISPVPKP